LIGAKPTSARNGGSACLAEVGASDAAWAGAGLLWFLPRWCTGAQTPRDQLRSPRRWRHRWSRRPPEHNPDL